MQHRHHLFYILLLSLFLADPTHREPIGPAVAVHVLIPRIEDQVPREEGRVPRSRPIVAVRAYVVHGRIVAVTCGGEEH